MSERARRVIPWAATAGVVILLVTLVIQLAVPGKALADQQGRDLSVAWSPAADSAERTFHGVQATRMVATARTTNAADASIEFKLLGPANAAYWPANVPTESGRVVMQKANYTLASVPGPVDTRVSIDDGLDGYAAGAQFSLIAIFRDSTGAVLSTKTLAITKPG